MSLFLVAVIASNIGFGFLRESMHAHSAKLAVPMHSPPAVPPVLETAAHHGQQAYIWAPIGHTPRHIRKNLFANDVTDTEDSPELRAIMPPQTARRSPGKGDGARTPSKDARSRSPGKGY